MGLDYKNLDDATRKGMISEIKRDAESGRVYISNYLNDEGREAWVEILQNAAAGGDDDTLASEIEGRGLLRTHAERRTKAGVTMVKVPYTAHSTLAEGEFGRYFARGLCLRAISEGISELEVYRAKEVMEPRPSSEEKIGTRVSPDAILDDLRGTQGVEPALGMPPGPNSGLMLKIPD